MAEYIELSDAEKEQANSIDLVDYLSRHGEKLLPSGKEKRLSSDHSITVRGNEWYDHSTNKGGLAIDFMMYFYNVNFQDAVLMLLNDVGGIIYRKNDVEEITKPFVLPEKNTIMRRTFGYLANERCIDYSVLTYFVVKNLIYESSESVNGYTFNNAIFVGYNEKDEVKHAHKHSINSNGKIYKGNIESSNPYYSFNFKGNSNRLYVFEAPIDMLSFISMYKDNNWQKYSYVALCGLSEKAMLKQIEINNKIDTVVLCLDNDDAGQSAEEKFEKLLSEKNLTVKRLVPKLKDFNEDLKQMKKEHEQSLKLKMA